MWVTGWLNIPVQALWENIALWPAHTRKARDGPRNGKIFFLNVPRFRITKCIVASVGAGVVVANEIFQLVFVPVEPFTAEGENKQRPISGEITFRDLLLKFERVFEHSTAGSEHVVPKLPTKPFL